MATKSVTLNSEQAQAGMDAINHRIGVYEKALKVTEGKVEWDDNEGTEVQNILNERKSATDLRVIIDNLKTVRSQLQQF